MTATTVNRRLSQDEGRRATGWPWVLRATWFVLPPIVGSALSSATADSSTGVRWTVLVVAWAWWAAGLLATVVAHPLGLVVLRVAGSTALLGTCAIAVDRWSFASAIALLYALTVAAVVLSPDTGHHCVNGPAYPNERRYLLRPPAVLLLGPLPVAGVLAVAGTAVGPVLLARRQWVLGAIAGLIGFVVAGVAMRSLFALARRFIVFVPAGFVIHDAEAVRDPVLFRSGVIESMGPAEVGTDALDLTARAPGLAVEVRLHEKVEITRVRNSQDTGEVGRTARFLVTPTLPGRFLMAARRRGFTS